MASKALLIVVVVFATIAAPTMAAEVFVVGDSTGWTPGFDYQTWAAGKEFHVGDILVFRYPVGFHNVVKVNGTDFKSCSAPLGAQTLTTGNDAILFTIPGRKWYLCSVGTHCQLGQKLFINVLPERSESPAPAPSPAASPIAQNGIFGVLAKVINARLGN